MIYLKIKMSEESYTYKKLKLKDLESDKSYYFYRTDNIMFYAVFDRIIGDNLIVKNYVSPKVKDGPMPVKIIPTNWIDYVESDEIKIKVNNFIY